MFITTFFKNIEIKAANTPIGTAKAKAALVSTPKVIAKVVASTVAVTGSDEIAPPISTAPMKIASREAPIKIPVRISPNIKPATIPTTKGRSIIVCPQSQLPPKQTNTQIAASVAVCNIIFSS